MAQGVGHRSIGWRDTGRRSEAAQRAVEDLLRERAAVVTDEQPGPVRCVPVETGSFLEVGVDRAERPARDWDVAWLAALGAGAHLEQHLLAVAFDAGDGE